MSRRISVLLVGVALGLGSAWNASAISDLTPMNVLATSATVSDGGDNPHADDVEAVLFGLGFTPCDLYEAYKADESNADGSPKAELGSLKDWYSTTFMDTALDPTDADIVWDGTSTSDPHVTPPAYLVAKGGVKKDPVWYLWDVGSLGWDGMEGLKVRGLWEGDDYGDKGAISHLSIFACEGTTVPEASTTLAMVGMALLGLSRVRREAR